MQLGDLRRRVTLQNYTDAVDEHGQEVRTWADIAEVWADMTYQSGGEDYQADQRVAERIVKFTIRYRSDVDETCRVYYDSRYFYIEGIERMHRKRYLILKSRYADRGV